MPASRNSVSAVRDGERPRLLRRQLLFAALLIFSAPVARAADKHWLFGTWEGERNNVAARNRTGTARQLIVTSVAKAGTSAKAQWITATGTVHVTLAIDGETVRFTTPGAQGNSYRLTHKGDTLEGTWTSLVNGNSGALQLFKQ